MATIGIEIVDAALIAARRRRARRGEPGRCARGTAARSRPARRGRGRTPETRARERPLLVRPLDRLARPCGRTGRSRMRILRTPQLAALWRAAAQPGTTPHSQCRARCARARSGLLLGIAAPHRHSGRGSRGFGARGLGGSSGACDRAAPRRAALPGRADRDAGRGDPAPPPRRGRAARRAEGDARGLGAGDRRCDGAPHALRPDAPGGDRAAALPAPAGMARGPRDARVARRDDRHRRRQLHRDRAARAVHARGRGLVRADFRARARRPPRRRARDARASRARRSARARRAARAACRGSRSSRCRTPRRRRALPRTRGARTRRSCRRSSRRCRARMRPSAASAAAEVAVAATHAILAGRAYAISEEPLVVGAGDGEGRRVAVAGAGIRACTARCCAIAAARSCATTAATAAS